MDYKGQELSEALYQYIIFAAMLAALVAGYVKASYQLMLMVFAAGVVLAGVVCVPDWAYFNRNPVRWLPSRKAEREGPAAGKGGAKGKGKRGAKGKARRD